MTFEAAPPAEPDRADPIGQGLRRSPDKQGQNRGLSPVLLAGADLWRSFGKTEVLKGVSITIAPGEIVALMGPSGSGKSTILHLLAGLLKPDRGSVLMEGQRIDELSEKRRSELRLKHCGLVFQFGDLIPELTLGENVELPLRLTGVKAGLARRHARDYLGRLGVADQADRLVQEVSGGQAQRAAVARALVHSPKVILADGPTGSLDTVTGELVLEAFVAAARDQGSAVLLVTHEPRVAAWASREVLLWDGRILGSSPPAIDHMHDAVPAPGAPWPAS
ncbi:MAG: ABC transporter ATP-binding protein [Bifidobacteriaceae bacterium]|jgi:putative ABC transport system ATP-binding protein|nr:ABC transporter ATP-binding protein [Bifidobacteriaceae bacterium]